MQQPHSTPALSRSHSASCLVSSPLCHFVYRRGYARLIGIVAVAMIVVGTLAATTSPPIPAVLQARRFEVVDDTGSVRFAAYATGKGGRVEVRNEAGQLVFSVGLAEDERELSGLWERLRLDVDQQHRDMARQEQALNSLTRRLQDLERQQQSVRRADLREQEIERRLRDLEQQRRTLDMLERQLQQLSRQLSTLERR